MRRRPVICVVGIVLSLAVATAANAEYSVRIEGATVPQGESDIVRVELSFACDANSDPVVEIKVADQNSPAYGKSSPRWRDQELCDGKTHPAIADVQDDSDAKFRKGDRIKVVVSLSGKQQQSARDEKEVTAK